MTHLERIMHLLLMTRQQLINTILQLIVFSGVLTSHSFTGFPSYPLHLKVLTSQTLILNLLDKEISETFFRN